MTTPIGYGFLRSEGAFLARRSERPASFPKLQFSTAFRSQRAPNDWRLRDPRKFIWARLR
jgi:hypothetical protein